MTSFDWKKALWVAAFIGSAIAHGHHDEPSEEDTLAPVDTILWIHMALQAGVWGVLFPIGMVLGLSKSRWHVPVQATGFLLTIGGYILGHSHKGRQFPPGAHGKFANILIIPILAQLVIGIYLKLHIHEQSIRPYVVKIHSVIGKSYPILAWTQMLFGAIAFQGYCRGGNLGQCLAHYIMGSGFIAYAVIMSIIFLVGENWVRRSGKSPEFWDSWCVWSFTLGLRKLMSFLASSRHGELVRHSELNTFTEHHGGAWSVKDMQHTILGVLWWTGGILGIFLSRNNQRNVVPAVILILTGWGMSSHAQALQISTMVHGMFGKTLMLAGATRIVEVVILPLASDSASDHTLHEGSQSSQERSPQTAASIAFRHTTPFLMVASGLLFMSATDEEMRFIHGKEMDHVTYILIIFSTAFLIYAFIVFLINLWATSGKNAPSVSGVKLPATGIDGMEYEMEASGPGTPRWYARVPNAEHDPVASRSKQTEPLHVVGDDDEDDDARETFAARH
ncbi:hypothetical protein DFP72DRAFT_879629 [Ephemerocybe angulata]|uniref:Integral membrane protein n=1 Tax=Ephemerocybe angulata TaxID=980116 RepID=A0A8H6MF69_9AGAR|nr:hypothetical protein DFP72DRAFT_879629 [Tulosesus angulatus]